MSDRKEAHTPHPGISRKQFLTALAGNAVAAGAAYAASRPTLGKLGVEVPFPDFTSNEPKTAEGYIDRISNDFGIEVPKNADFQYKVDTRLGNYVNILEDGLNTKLNLDEAKILHETLGRVPAAGHLVQLIIPYRFAGAKVFAGGTYEGYFWPVGKGERMDESLPDIIENEKPQTPYFASNKAAFELKLPNGVRMADPLPTKNPDDVPLGILSAASAGIAQLNLNEELPWITHGERLKQAVVHELGHGLIDQVALARDIEFRAECQDPQSIEIRRQCTLQASEDVKQYYQSKGISLIMGAPVDSNHPLLSTFAEINGWELLSAYQFANRYTDNTNLLEKYRAKDDEISFWDRDPTVWGDLKNREPRLTTYASYEPIQEAFCEFWMASILYPEFLTDSERRYFAKIHNDLKKDPDSFIQQIAHNPVDF